MQAILTSLIAVAGTLLGASLTYLFQSRTNMRAQRFSRDERLRQERLGVYSAYAGAVLDLRRKVSDKWQICVEVKADPVACRDADAAAITSSVVVYEALAKVMLVTDDVRVTELARAAMESIAVLSEAESAEELEHRRTETRDAVERFIEAAATHVR